MTTTTDKGNLSENNGDLPVGVGRATDSAAREVLRHINNAIQNVDVHAQVTKRHEDYALIRETLQLLRTLFAPTIAGDRTFGPFHQFLNSAQVSRLLALLATLENTLEKAPVKPDRAGLSIISGQILQVITDVVAEALTDFTLTQAVRSFLVRLADQVSTINARRTTVDANAIQNSRIVQEESIGATSESELAREFADYANHEMRSGYGWLVTTVLLVIGTVVLTFRILNLAEPLSWQSFTSHLIIALPCVGLAAYCAREASRHRESARWSARIAVQLKSVSAYTARLDQSSKDVLLSAFGLYIFGPHSKNDENQLHAVPPEFWKIATDALKSRLPGA